MAASRVSSSPAKRWCLASADSSIVTSKPSWPSRFAARFKGVALARTPAGVNRVSVVVVAESGRLGRREVDLDRLAGWDGFVGRRLRQGLGRQGGAALPVLLPALGEEVAQHLAAV